MVIREDEEVPVPLEHTEVTARIDGYIASVDVSQLFHNPFEETIEAEYVFNVVGTNAPTVANTSWNVVPA